MTNRPSVSRRMELVSSGKAEIADTCAVPERLISGPYVGFENSRDAVRIPSRLIKPRRPR
jgi:hypothetical protein